MDRLLAALLLSFALATPVSAQMFQCEGRLIQAGATEAHVRELCGPPTSNRREIRTFDEGLEGELGTRRVAVDIWFYDRGETQFTKKLTFVDGVLESIVNGDYGG